MAEYRVAHHEGTYYMVKIGGYQGVRATILPPVWELLSRLHCECLDDIVELTDFEEVRFAHPHSIGVRT